MDQDPPQDPRDAHAKKQPHARPVARHAPPADAPARPAAPPPPGPAADPASTESRAVPMAGTALEAGASQAAPPAGPKRLLGTADLAFISRIPARKPETLDRDAIARAFWLVGSLALGLWVITLFARPSANESTPPPPAVIKEAPPIVLPGNGAAPPSFLPAETPPPVISLTPPPAAPVMTGNPAWPDAASQPVANPPAARPEAEGPARPAADMPDPSNLFLGD